MQVFLFGLGYSATALAKRLVADGVPVAGTTRDSEKCTALRAQGVQAFLVGDNGNPIGAEAEACRDAVRQASHVINSCPPFRGAIGQGKSFDDAGLRLLRVSLEQAHDSPALSLRWCGYLSSTVVYGDHQGAEVDESSATVALEKNPVEKNPVEKNPVEKDPSGEEDASDGIALAYRRAFNRLQSESAWQEWCANHGVAFACFRLAGIYGPGRNAFLALRKGTARRIVRDNHLTGRIHQDDIATALRAALQISQTSQNSAQSVCGVFNLCDDAPAAPAEVMAYAAELLGLAPPPAEPWAEAQKTLSPMASSFYQGSRRVRARRTKEVLDWKPQYPSYREGLQALLQSLETELETE